MPTLEWIGKSKVINHHQDVPFRVLERKYSFDENGQHDEDNGSENMIIRGDNLEALKALLPRYEGRVKCIYIDPPYNTAKSSEKNKAHAKHTQYVLCADFFQRLQQYRGAYRQGLEQRGIQR